MTALCVWSVPVFYPMCILQFSQNEAYHDFLLLYQFKLLFCFFFPTVNPLIAETLGSCTTMKNFKCHIISEKQLSTPVDQSQRWTLMNIYGLYRSRNHLWSVVDADYGQESNLSEFEQVTEFLLENVTDSAVLCAFHVHFTMIMCMQYWIFIHFPVNLWLTLGFKERSCGNSFASSLQLPYHIERYLTLTNTHISIHLKLFWPKRHPSTYLSLVVSLFEQINPQNTRYIKKIALADGQIKLPLNILT
jgi:hypothetical protein